jgi:hypothetical protein
VIDVIYVSIPIEVECNVCTMCSECVRARHDTVEYSVSVRRGWLYACVGYCNSPLNNKNTDYHFPWFFPSLGFHINHFVNCVFVVLGLMRV